MLQVRMFGILQIVKNCTSRNDSQWKGLNSESFERMCLKMPEQVFSCISFVKYPTLQRISIKTVAIGFFKYFLVIFLEDYFSRPQCLKQLINIVRTAFCCKKFSG